jgi:hypothetical protein
LVGPHYQIDDNLLYFAQILNKLILKTYLMILETQRYFLYF